MKKKADRLATTVETFADGSSLETCPDGSVLLREGRLARALPVRSEEGHQQPCRRGRLGTMNRHPARRAPWMAAARTDVRGYVPVFTIDTLGGG